MTWQLQTAKAQFSELFRRAREEGPQRVTRRGREAVVVVPAEEYDRLTAPKARLKGDSLVKILRKVPLYKLKIERSRDTKMRDIGL
jgi:prevent-host-death family protein